MNFDIVKVKEKEKELLYNLLQFALYDGSFYIDNNIDDNCLFPYKWFENYFTDPKRQAYFIKRDNNYLGMVLVNEHLKFNKTGKCIAEFLIMPRYRRQHIGKQVAFIIFDMYKGDWEVQPMENNPIAYNFWKNTVIEYTNNNYKVQNDGTEDVFIFKSRQ